MFSAKEYLKNIQAYSPGQSIESIKAKYGLEKVIKLASNENPLGPAVSVQELLAVKTAEYPDLALSPLFQKVLQKHSLSKSQLVFGNGSDEILQLIALAYLGSQDALMTSTVSFSEYAFMAQVMGADLIQVPIKNNTYDLEAFKDRWTEKVKVICIANPNNPTGTLVSHEEIESLLEFVDGRSLLLLDEAYAEYVTDKSYPDSERLIKKYPNVIVTRTFSKLYGLASYRVGYGMGQDDLIQALYRVRQPFNVNGLALKAAELALDQQSFVKKSLRLNEEGKQVLYDFFEYLALPYQKSEANFVYVDLNKGLAKDMCENMLKKGVILRSMHGFGREKGLRVTVGTKEQLEVFKTVFEAVYAHSI